MSNSKTIKHEIDELEAKQRDLQGQLDHLASHTKPDMVRAASEWINDEVQRQIEKRPAVINQLGAERVRSMKDQVRGLVDSLPNIIRVTAGSMPWPHRPSNPPAAAPTKEAFFSRFFREVINNLGPILSEFGLISARDMSPTWQHQSDGKVRYLINPGFDDRKIPSIINYNVTLAEYQNNDAQISKKRKELEQVSAKELWESA